MLTKRIIPCLDVMDGKVVKGKSFKDLRYAGDVVVLAKRYNNLGADELVFLDITASYERRKILLELVREAASQLFIPLTVGGGIRNLEDIRQILSAGADKVSLNTAAVKNPRLITQASKMFGSQCIVVAIDAKKQDISWQVYINGGREKAGIDVISWAIKAEKLGAGEILLTSMDCDGKKTGYDVALTKSVSQAVNIPVIASGGAGSLADISEVFKTGKADAALIASILHYSEFTIKDIKKYLKENDVEVRL